MNFEEREAIKEIFREVLRETGLVSVSPAPPAGSYAARIADAQAARKRNAERRACNVE